MSCEAIQGYTQNCVQSTPGVRTVFIAQLPSGYTQTDINEIVTVDETSQLVTALSGATSGLELELYKYEFTKDTAHMEATGTPDGDGDMSSFDHVVSLAFKKMQLTTRNKIMLLAANSKLAIIIGDKNDNYHLCGAVEGARMTQMNGTTGMNSGEANKYDLIFTANENHLPYLVDPSAIAPAIVG